MFDAELDQMRLEIGARVRDRRKLLGMTQLELANAMGYKAPHRISQIELGRQRLFAEEVPRLCAKLVCSPDDIILGKPDGGVAAD